MQRHSPNVTPKRLFASCNFHGEIDGSENVSLHPLGCMQLEVVQIAHWHCKVHVAVHNRSKLRGLITAWFLDAFECLNQIEQQHVKACKNDMQGARHFVDS